MKDIWTPEKKKFQSRYEYDCHKNEEYYDRSDFTVYNDQPKFQVKKKT